MTTGHLLFLEKVGSDKLVIQFVFYMSATTKNTVDPRVFVMGWTKHLYLPVNSDFVWVPLISDVLCK